MKQIEELCSSKGIRVCDRGIINWSNIHRQKRIKAMVESFRGLIAEGRLREGDIEAVAKTIIYSLHGLIMLYFVDKTEMNEEKVYQELDKILDFIL